MASGPCSYELLQKSMNPNGIVVDGGSGPCLFINEVRAAGVRHRCESRHAEPRGTRRRGYECAGSSLADLPDASVDHSS